MAELTYAEKLRDPRWQKRRLEILERDNWSCQQCFDTESTLAVHHRKYLTNVEPWDYPDELLITLCEDCHKAEREQVAEYVPLLLDNLRAKFFADDLRELALGVSNLEIIHDSSVTATMLTWMLSSPELMWEMKERYFAHLREKVRKPCPEK